MTATSYTIKLAQFEGPFDLLLFFIQRDELDINDIPIAKVTDDFLEFIRQMERLNIDLASEFIVVAATLMRIKSRLLLPRKEIDEEGNEIDPRQELIQKLLEYKRYKGILEEMRGMEEKRSAMFSRGNITNELQQVANKALVDVELESLSLYKILKTFKRVMERYDDSKRRAVHHVYSYNFTVRGQKKHIRSLLKVQDKMDFAGIFSQCENRIHAIINFLSILELANLEVIQIVLGEGRNNFWIKKGDLFDEDIEEKDDFDAVGQREG